MAVKGETNAQGTCLLVKRGQTIHANASPDIMMRMFD